jgi:hypothetical protein
MYRFWKVIAIVAMALALLGLGATLALAQGTLPAISATPSFTGVMNGMMGGRYGGTMGGMMGGQGGMMMGGPHGPLVDIAAAALNMTRAELLAELNAGNSIAQVAEKRGVPLDNIVAAFMTSHEGAMHAAVEAGRMTQAQADTMLARMRDHVRARLTSAWQPGQNSMPGWMDQNGDGVCDHMGNGDWGPMGPGMMGPYWQQQ